MSRIRRILTPQNNQIYVAGKNTGGGIAMVKKTPEKDCPAIGGGDCVPDNYVSQWVARAGASSNPLQYMGTTLTLYTDDVYPVLYGVVADTENPITDATSLCCSDVTWDVTVVSGSINYDVVNGMLIVTGNPAAGGEIHATPTVCGNTLGMLTYIHEGE